MGFLATVSLFSDFPQHILRMIYRKSTIRKYMKDFLVYGIGEKSEFVYFIKEGEIEISELIELYNEQEFVEEKDISSLEELQKQSSEMRKAEYNKFNSSFQDKHVRKLKKILPVSFL